MVDSRSRRRLGFPSIPVRVAFPRFASCRFVSCRTVSFRTGSARFVTLRCVSCRTVSSRCVSFRGTFCLFYFPTVSFRVVALRYVSCGAVSVSLRFVAFHVCFLLVSFHSVAHFLFSFRYGYVRFVDDQIFGMTASPTIECVSVLQSRAYVCEDDLIEEYQANAPWEMLYYPVSGQA